MVEATKKPKKKVSPKSLANLVQYSAKYDDAARKEHWRKSSAKAREAHRQKKCIRDYLVDMLSGKVKDIPLEKATIDELCATYGVRKNDTTASQIAGRVAIDSLKGIYKALELAYKADGSEVPTQIEFGGSGFSINIVNGKDTKETQGIWENDIDDLEE